MFKTPDLRIKRSNASCKRLAALYVTAKYDSYYWNFDNAKWMLGFGGSIKLQSTPVRFVRKKDA